jgi:protein-S-isoprenylcysteine O-methyltransferase Ste14
VTSRTIDLELEDEEETNRHKGVSDKKLGRRKKRRTESADVPKADQSSDLSPLSRYGYLSGIAGAVTVMAMGYLASRRGAMDHGWHLYPSATPPSPHLSAGFVLLVIAVIMYAIELAIRLAVDRGKVISVADDVRAKRYGRFVEQCVKVYLVDLGLLALVFWFYRHLNEYGFERSAPYYQPWFALVPYFWWTYVIIGLPYVLCTRAFQHDPDSDRKQPAFMAMKAIHALAYRLRLVTTHPAPFDKYDQSALLGIFVKGFYVPLMTVFFSDQFSHLVRNWGYVRDVLNHTTNPVTVVDVWNVSHSVIFAIDVGVAWAGYAISSRWIKNTLFSVEPTLTGWAVALMCYPPFQNNFGFYFSTPNENAFLSLQASTAVNILTVCSILSFAVYTSATVCFGLRFSNLTHRGIITTGPYALIRHPAYAAKNFSWWCIMFPFALHQIFSGQLGAFYQVIGLVAMTGVYYLRARTEEWHLEKDPEYRKYCKKVPYRFVPGVF